MAGNAISVAGNAISDGLKFLKPYIYREVGGISGPHSRPASLKKPPILKILLETASRKHAFPPCLGFLSTVSDK